jgi:hypothetical protein
MIAIGEFETIGQETSKVCFKVFSCIRLEGLRKIKETVDENIRCPCSHSNPLPPECLLLVQASPLEPGCSLAPGFTFRFCICSSDLIALKTMAE